jgi:hypothetical protein
MRKVVVLPQQSDKLALAHLERHGINRQRRAKFG